MPVASNALRSAPFRNTVLILAGLVSLAFAVILGIILLLVGAPWWLAIPVGLLDWLLVTLLWTRGASARVKKRLGLNDSLVCTDPGLKNLVEGLSLSIGTEEPMLYLVPDQAKNALPFADEDGACLVVTSSLLESLGRMELEAIVAELLVRVKSGEAEVGTAAAGTFGDLFLDGALSGVGSSIGGWAMRRVVPADSDIEADRRAVGVTRYPPGLSSALTRIADSFSPAMASAGNDHLWIAPPLTTEAAVPHSPLQWRIDILLEF